MSDHVVPRAFKSAWFAKAASKATISDALLCKAIAQTMAGQADNQYRSIILARGGNWWVYEYLFGKQNRANIEDDELKAFRNLAKAYAGLTAEQVDALVAAKDWIEICKKEPEDKR